MLLGNDASYNNQLPKRKRRRRHANSINESKDDNHHKQLSFQEKSERNFPRWYPNLIVIPSVFRHDSEGIPIGTLDKGGQAALKGPRKEKDFLDRMKEFGIGKPAIVLHSLKFRELFEHYNLLLAKNTETSSEKPHQLRLKEAFRKARHYAPTMNELSQEAEVDFMMLVKSKGFFLFEVKSSISERGHAKQQLEVRRALMNVLIDDAIAEGNLGDWSSRDLPNYCASIFPSSRLPASPNDPPSEDEFFENSFSTEEHWKHWWNVFIESKPTLESEVNELFMKVVSRIVYTVTNYMPLTLSEGIAELGDDIQQQRVLKTFGNVTRIGYDIDQRNGEVKSTKLSNEQVAILNGFRRQIVKGPTGSGKTLIIAAKALQLSTLKKQVLIVCGDSCEGLKYWYTKVFKLNRCYGHDHLDYIYVCTLSELHELKELDPVENYCLVDEADEIVGEKNKGDSPSTYTELWTNILKKPFVWVATDSDFTLKDIKATDDVLGNDHLLKVTSLRTVLRNTVNIFKEFQDQISERFAADDDNSQVVVGHDVEGLPVHHSAFSNINELCGQVICLINKLSEKRSETSVNIREMEHRDILIYVTVNNTEDLPAFDYLLTELKNSNVPFRTFHRLVGAGFVQSVKDPLSNSVLLAWIEKDILSLEFLAVISCEINCVASPTVLSRAVSQLFRLHYHTR